MAAAIDLHQHLWPAPLVELLRRRTRAPYLRGWTLHTAGEAPYDVRVEDHDVDRRIALDLEAGIGLACPSLSAPLGLESLPREEADAALAAWHEGAATLPAHFAPWASVPVVDPDPAGLAELLAGPFVGVQLPATQVATPGGWDVVGDVLAVAASAGKPVFVHPGPTAVDGAPSWWAPVVGYVAQLQAAWWGWHAAAGRAQHPSLRLVFAAGAGLAPLQHERLAARGGDAGTVDRDVFVETSSYGAQGVDALIRVLGIDVVALGSDRPYAEPLPALFGEAATRAIRVDNPRRALGAGQVDQKLGEAA
ncbi:amidohydrolase [Nocardioides sp. W7]|uniref:amidohydrolase family protein n=1 Tax=Nocardioides sp. W7 TaxID=2931390 RepID=UPI001FD51A52|nr:amidohydrolase [Nocardioides sp. W7]